MNRVFQALEPPLHRWGEVLCGGLPFAKFHPIGATVSPLRGENLKIDCK